MSGGINRIKYTPAARPVDTVGVDTSFQQMAAPVAPVKPLAPTMGQLPAPAPINNQAEQLVQALVGFSTGVAKLASQYDEQRRKDDEREAEFEAMKSEAKSWEEAVRNDPSLASKSPFFKDVFQARVASTSMQRRIGELQAEYYNSDIKNSTDPGAIQKWFIERIQPTLDQFKDPAERQAAIDQAIKQAQAFAQAHATNATNNLLQKNSETYGAAVQSDLDEHGRKPAAKSYPTEDVVLTDLAPEKRAVLAGIAVGESAGRYNNRYSAGQGHVIDVNAPHDGKMYPGPEGPSSASGKYMFTVTTWKRIWNGQNPPMTPENQDKAALMLAEQDYKARTGGDLWEDVKKEGFSNRIQAQLAPTWAALKHNRARNAATFNEALTKAGAQLPDSPSADPNLDETAASIYEKADQMVKQGLSPEKVDADTVQAVINSAIMNKDPSHLKILDIARPGGRPALGQDPKVRAQVMAAQNSIRSLQVQEENAKAQLKKQQQEAAKDNVKRAVYTQVLDKLSKGEDPTISNDMMKAATALDPDLFTTFQNVNKTLSEANKEEDAATVNELQRQLYTGQLSVDDVFKAVGAGQLRNPQTISRFYQEAQQNQEKTYLTGPILNRALGSIDSFLNDPNRFDFEKRGKSMEAQALLRKAYKDFMDANPKATLREQDDFVQNEMNAILGGMIEETPQYMKDAAVKAGKTPAGAPSAAAGAVDPAKPQTPPVPPAAAPKGNLAEWRTKPIFKSREDFDAAVAQYRKDFTGPLADAVRQYGLKTNDDIADFYVAQRKLIPSK